MACICPNELGQPRCSISVCKERRGGFKGWRAVLLIIRRCVTALFEFRTVLSVFSERTQDGDQVLGADFLFSACSPLNTCVHVSDVDERLLLPPLMNTGFSTTRQSCAVASMGGPACRRGSQTHGNLRSMFNSEEELHSPTVCQT